MIRKKDRLDQAWGVSVTGSLFYNSLNSKNVDPFYPTVFKEVSWPKTLKDNGDGCQAHISDEGIYYYQTASTCIPATMQSGSLASFTTLSSSSGPQAAYYLDPKLFLN